jgi:hypothetical protein
MNKLKEVTESQRLCKKHEFIDETKNPESYDERRILGTETVKKNEVNFEVNFFFLNSVKFSFKKTLIFRV